MLLSSIKERCTVVYSRVRIQVEMTLLQTNEPWSGSFRKESAGNVNIWSLFYCLSDISVRNFEYWSITSLKQSCRVIIQKEQKRSGNRSKFVAPRKMQKVQWCVTRGLEGIISDCMLLKRVKTFAVFKPRLSHTSTFRGFNSRAVITLSNALIRCLSFCV